jgi:hypothetical protein
LFLTPLIDGSVNGFMGFFRADTIDFVLGRLRQRPVILASAQLGAETVMVTNQHIAFFRRFF